MRFTNTANEISELKLAITTQICGEPKAVNLLDKYNTSIYWMPTPNRVLRLSTPKVLMYTIPIYMFDGCTLTCADLGCCIQGGGLVFSWS